MEIELPIADPARYNEPIRSIIKAHNRREIDASFSERRNQPLPQGDANIWKANYQNWLAEQRSAGVASTHQEKYLRDVLKECRKKYRAGGLGHRILFTDINEKMTEEGLAKFYNWLGIIGIVLALPWVLGFCIHFAEFGMYVLALVAVIGYFFACVHFGKAAGLVGFVSMCVIYGILLNNYGIHRICEILVQLWFK